MSTTDSLMVNGLGYNSSYSDKYLMQALNSPNYYQMGLNQNMGLGTANSDTSLTNTLNPTFGSAATTGTIARAATQKSSNAVLATSITALAALGGTAVWIASRGRSAGAKGFINQIKAGLKSFGKSAANDSKIHLLQVNGKTVYTIPNKTQTFRGADIQKNMDKLGLSVNENLKHTDPEAIWKNAQIEIVDNGIKNRITFYQNGKIRCYNLTDGKTFNLDDCSDAFKDSVKKAQEAFKAKNETQLAQAISGAKFENIVYGQQVAPGTQALYIAKPTPAKNSATITEGLKVVKTNRVAADSNLLYQARANNAKLDEIIKAIEAKKANYNNLSVASATYTPTGIKKFNGESWPSGIKVQYENGKVVGIVDTNNGNKVIKFGDECCDTLKYKFPKAFEPLNDISKFDQEYLDIVLAA